MSEETRQTAEDILDVTLLGMRGIVHELRDMQPSLEPAHWRLLRILARGPHHLHELAAKRGVSAATMSHSISTLVERGWVVRAPDRRDRRRVLIELTPLGQQVLAAIQQQLSARIAEILQPLSPTEVEPLTAALSTLRRIFSQIMQGKAEAVAETSPPQPQS